MSKESFGALLIVVGFVGFFLVILFGFITWSFTWWHGRMLLIFVVIYLVGNVIWEKHK